MKFEEAIQIWNRTPLYTNSSSYKLVKHLDSGKYSILSNTMVSKIDESKLKIIKK